MEKIRIGSRKVKRFAWKVLQTLSTWAILMGVIYLGNARK